MHFVTGCPICGNQSSTPELNAKDYTVSHETFSIVGCTACGFHYTNPRPNNENLGRYYQSKEYVSHTKRSTSIVDIIYRISRKFTLRWKMRLVTTNVNSKEIRLLDFGCGTGDFIHHCSKHGVTTEAVEPSPNARTIAEENLGKKIHSNLDTVTSKFNAITLWHVLEHVPDLNEKVSALKDRLTENGIMFIALPNHESYDASKYKEHWAGYDVPRHLWHFSKSNVQALLIKHQLKLVKIIPMKLDAYYVSILSNKYVNGKITPSGFAKGLLTGLQSNIKATKNQQYSSLIYIAKKK